MRVSALDIESLPFHPSQIAEPLHERLHGGICVWPQGHTGAKKTDAWLRCPLGVDGTDPKERT